MDGVSHRVGGFLLPSDAALEQLSGSGSYGTNADYSNAGMGYDSVLIHGTSKGEFRMTLVSEKRVFDGVQMLYRFENGYGASVIRHLHSYGSEDGLWELAVIQWGEGIAELGEDQWDIVYDTGITDDVLGRLQWSTVIEILGDIKDLPPIEPEDDLDDRQPDEAQEWYDFDPEC